MNGIAHQIKENGDESASVMKDGVLEGIGIWKWGNITDMGYFKKDVLVDGF